MSNASICPIHHRRHHPGKGCPSKKRLPDEAEPVSVVGSLYVDADKRAAKKPSGVHTSAAPCGCEVTVTYLSPNSQGVRYEFCTIHPKHPVKERTA